MRFYPVNLRVHKCEGPDLNYRNIEHIEIRGNDISTSSGEHIAGVNVYNQAQEYRDFWYHLE